MIGGGAASIPTLTALFLLFHWQANSKRKNVHEVYYAGVEGHNGTAKALPEDYTQVIEDLREFDVPYYVRCCIDMEASLLR